MNKIKHYLPEILILVYMLIFMITKQPWNPWDRMIATDGKGYYAYLPAFFIYGDTDFDFIDSYESKYYPPGGELYKDFRVETGKGIVNKYFPGTALLWIPFFLIAHAVANLSGFPADGYSIPYQLAIGLAALFYFWLALHLLRRVLRHYTKNENLIALTLVGISLGTNLIYYTVNAPSQVHVYNFFLITAFVLCVLNACNGGAKKHIYLALLLLGMIIISRPQNGIIVFSIPFLCGSKDAFMRLIKDVFSDVRTFLLSFILLCIPLLLPVFYWMFVTGQPLVYTYGNESYNLLQPNIVLFLFSFEKGWMLYTPLAAFSVFGFIYLYQRSKWEFISLSAFLFFLVYFLSSWWVWNYTSYISQRVMIDFYVFLAILLIHVFLYTSSGRLKKVTTTAFVLLISLTVFQYFQQLKWIYPAGPVTAKSYFNNFFSLTKQNTYYISPNEIETIHTFSLQGTDSKHFMLPEKFFNKDRNHSQCLVYTHDPAEKLLFARQAAIDNDTNACVLRIGAWYLANITDSVFHVKTSFGKSRKVYSVNYQNIVSGFRPGKWTYIETALYLPYLRYSCDSVFVSIVNLTGDTVLVNNLKIEFIKMKGVDKHEWIPSAADDVQSFKRYATDMEKKLESPWCNESGISFEKSSSGKRSSLVNALMPYSVSFELALDSADNIPESYLKVNSQILLASNGRMALIVDFSSKGKTVLYKSYPVIKPDTERSWFNFEISRELPIRQLKADKVKIYFWYQNGDSNAYIDDIKVEQVFYKKARRSDSNPLVLASEMMPNDFICENFDSKIPAFSGFIQASPFAKSGNQVCVCNSTHPFSFSHKLLINKENAKLNSVRVNANVMSDQFKSNAVMVVDFQSNGKSVSYMPVYLNSSVIKGEWVGLDLELKYPKLAQNITEAIIYFYSPSFDEELMIDDFCVKLNYLK